MIRSALEFILNLKEAKIMDVNGGTYSDKNLHRIKKPTADGLRISTLTALVDYIKSGLAGKEKSSGQLLVHVAAPDTVTLLSELNVDCERDVYMECKALLPNNIQYSRFIDVESFNIMLQSAFVDTYDTRLLLKSTGLITEKDVKETGDNGISQSIVVKTGIAKVEEVEVPNPVTLAPYRTFPEIEQPESRFIFRMQSGPKAALYEADGGAWRNKAMEWIKKWLEEQLAGVDFIKIIS